MKPEIWKLTYEIRKHKFEIWNMQYGIWDMKPETWNMKSEIWNMKPDICNMKSEIGNLKSEIWNLTSDKSNLKSEIWNMEAGIWNMTWELWKLKSEIWNPKYGTWNLTSELWNMKSEIWNLKYEIWNLKSDIEGISDYLSNGTQRMQPIGWRPKKPVWAHSGPTLGPEGSKRDPRGTKTDAKVGDWKQFRRHFHSAPKWQADLRGGAPKWRPKRPLWFHSGPMLGPEGSKREPRSSNGCQNGRPWAISLVTFTASQSDRQNSEAEFRNDVQIGRFWAHSGPTLAPEGQKTIHVDPKRTPKRETGDNFTCHFHSAPKWQAELRGGVPKWRP